MTLKTYTSAEMSEIIEKHRKWILGDAGGSRANLSGADLSGAYLSGANLSRAYLSGADLPGFQLPLEGSLVVYKKLQAGVVAKLLIPEGVARTASLVGRKCRAASAQVLELLDSTGSPVESGRSKHMPSVIYRVGETITPDGYNDDPRIECTNGVHFFLSRVEAERY